MNEQELIEELRQGNEPAFRWLVENYRNRVFHTVLNILQDIHEAEDAVQDTFIQVFESIRSFKEESSLSSYLIGLVVLALAGFYFFKKSSTVTVQKKAPAAAPAKASYALTTGVAKYLNKVSGTGVSRYLEKHVKSSSAATGVAKYMAKQAASPKTTAAKAATGVEKYMRDRG